LHNNIYDYCYETLYKLRSGQPQHRRFLALTLVCQQLRNEYRPWYLVLVTAGMRLEAAPAYINAFYLETDPTTPYLTHGHIQVYVPDVYTKPVSLIPLVRLRTSAPNVHLHLEKLCIMDHYNGSTVNVGMLKYILKEHDLSRLLENLPNTSIANVELSSLLDNDDPDNSVRDAHLTVTFKKEVAASWMDGVTRYY
jgi:hypothetical protein